MQFSGLARPLFSLVACLVLLQAATGRAQQTASSADKAQTDTAMPPEPPDDKVVSAPASPDAVVRLSYVEGNMRLSDSTGKLFDQVLQNMAMLPGMSLETGSNGRAELEFPDGTVARVTPNSTLSLSPLTHDAAGRAHLTLKPLKGLTYYELPPAASSYSVQVGPLTALNPSTSERALLRVNLDSTPYQAATLQGTVHFEDASGNAFYDLASNQTARIDPTAATNYDIVMDLTPDSWDAWNADRRSVRAQIAQAPEPPGGNAGPGWNDLNYYGSWYDVPGQGQAWAPDGVDASFDPYGSGAWTYSTGYATGAGYGWTSSYPWGWLPYHCGLWNYYQTYGWMWLPSNCGWGAGAGYGGGFGGGWYPYTGAHMIPRSYKLPSRPQPPTGITRRPISTLIAVHQGPPVHFRVLGEARPAARTLVVSGVPVQPLPVEARPSYSPVTPAGELWMTQGRAGRLQNGQAGQAGQTGQTGYGAGARMAHPPSSAPRVYQAPGQAAGQAPRVQSYTPAPRPSAPAAVSAPAPASHVSAPPAASAGHGH